MMDAELCRAHLAQLLSEETAALNALQQLLDREHQLITSNDIEGLESAGREREQVVNSLMRIDADRHTLCRSTGRSPDKAGLLSLLQWCDPSGALNNRWQGSVDMIRRCRSLNERNGALVSNRMKRVETLLDTLNGPEARNSRTYSQQGNAYAKTVAGRVCSIQA